MNFERDNFTNYKYEDFKSIKECFDVRAYSFYCHCLCRWGRDGSYYYLLRISDIEIVDGEGFIFVCPAYRINEDMAKRKSVLTEPNKLGLTPGKLSIDLPEASIKLDFSNSVYDNRLKKRIPLSEVKSSEPIPKKGKEKEKIEDEMVNNTDTNVDGKLHSSHFLPPTICTRLWVLSRGVKVGWGWYLRAVDGYKNKYEYYCRPIELLDGHEQYSRGGDFFTYAYMKSEFVELDREEFQQDKFIFLSKKLSERQVESIQVVIDAMLCQNIQK